MHSDLRFRLSTSGVEVIPARGVGGVRAREDDISPPRACAYICMLHMYVCVCMYIYIGGLCARGKIYPLREPVPMYVF